MLPTDRTVAMHYAALGDSTVFGVGASSPDQNYVSLLHAWLRADYPAARMTNLGVSGATSADVIEGQLPRALALRPDLVTLSIGPNDITQGRDVGEFERNVDAIFRAITRDTDAVVVVSLLPDMSLAPIFSPEEKAAVGRLAASFNDVLERAARAYDVEVVDVYRASQDEIPNRDDLVSEDGYHPSDQGYARWAELMSAGLEARIP